MPPKTPLISAKAAAAVKCCFTYITWRCKHCSTVHLHCEAQPYTHLGLHILLMYQLMHVLQAVSHSLCQFLQCTWQDRTASHASTIQRPHKQLQVRKLHQSAILMEKQAYHTQQRGDDALISISSSEHTCMSQKAKQRASEMVVFAAERLPTP